VIHRGLVLVAFACCALCVASFGMFARDQLAGASKHQQQLISSGAPQTQGVPAISSHHAQPRRFIDAAAQALISPFRSLVQSDSQWVLHGVPTLFALLVYGVGLGFLARYQSGRV
jgi:hypothetical protein